MAATTATLTPAPSPGTYALTVAPTDATCTSRVVPRESFGAFHAHTCGHPAKGLNPAGEPRCGVHARAEAGAAERQANRHALERARLQTVQERQAKQAAEASLYADLLLLARGLVAWADGKPGATSASALADQARPLLTRADSLEA